VYDLPRYTLSRVDLGGLLVTAIEGGSARLSRGHLIVLQSTKKKVWLDETRMYLFNVLPYTNLDALKQGHTSVDCMYFISPYHAPNMIPGHSTNWLYSVSPEVRTYAMLTLLMRELRSVKLRSSWWHDVYCVLYTGAIGASLWTVSIMFRIVFWDVPLKRRSTIILHCSTSQKTILNSYSPPWELEISQLSIMFHSC
jgi:hypothetical protein